MSAHSTTVDHKFHLLPPTPLLPQTTAIHMLTGFLRPTSGAALVWGRDISTEMGEVS